jgi:hypothetical protein
MGAAGVPHVPRVGVPGVSVVERAGMARGVCDESPVVPAPPPRALWPFIALLGAMGVLLAGAAVDSTQLGLSWVVTALAVSVIAHLGAGRRVAPAILVPTMSWAFLLAERASTEESRRAWTRATVGGMLTAAAALGLAGVRQSGLEASVQLIVASVALGWALSVMAVATARGEGAAVLWSRLALVPATLFGCGLLVAAALASAPLTLLAGKLPASGWLVGQAGRALGAIAIFGHAGHAGHAGDVGHVGQAGEADDADLFGAVHQLGDSRDGGEHDGGRGSTRAADDEWSVA